jgi:hypothetical protein
VQVSGLIAGNGGRAFLLDGMTVAAGSGRSGWTLVTRNTADLARSAVMLLNPFDSRPPT